MADNKAKTGIRSSPVLTTAIRALGFGKTYFFMALVVGLGVLFLVNPTYVNSAPSSNSVNSTSTQVHIGGISVAGVHGIPLLAVPFTVVPMILLTTPMAVLFVYDKNNGVLEYLLSLGMTQRGIYMRYLKAALLTAFAYLVVFITLNVIYSYVLFGIKYLPVLLTIFSIGSIIAIATVAFIITMMMAFSSLQKSRAGANQPLAMMLGTVSVIPDYFIPFVFPFNTAIAVEILQAAIIAVIALTLTLLSGKLIRREKLLP